MKRTFMKKPVKAATYENRKYHACQLCFDVAVSAGTDTNDLLDEVREGVMQVLDRYADKVDVVFLLGDTVEDMDHAYSDISIESFM